MNFFQELMIAIFLPRKNTPSVQYRLSAAQQHRVMRQCEEINALIQQVHVNLSDIRRAGSATSRLARETHHKQLQGRKSLRQQQLECERINSELRKISEEMRTVRHNVAQASRKSYLAMNRVRQLDSTVATMSVPLSDPQPASTPRVADVTAFPSINADYSS